MIPVTLPLPNSLMGMALAAEPSAMRTSTLLASSEYLTAPLSNGT